MEKMSKVLLTSKTAWSSRLCALTWKERDTKSGRSIFQLQVSALPTEEKESGLWLTPSASMIANRSEKAMEHRIKYRKSIGRTTVPPGNLAEQVKYGKKVTDMKMWRTPDAHCDRGASSEERMQMKLNKKMPISINDQVAHPNLMWPTPRASKAMSENIENIKQRGTDKARLEERVAKMWPTPTVNDSKNNGGPSQYRRKSHGKPRGLDLNAKVGGALNPTWVEWLMGYPAEYTDLKHWETLSSRKSRKK